MYLKTSTQREAVYWGSAHWTLDQKLRGRLLAWIKIKLAGDGDFEYSFTQSNNSTEQQVWDSKNFRFKCLFQISDKSAEIRNTPVGWQENFTYETKDNFILGMSEETVLMKPSNESLHNFALLCIDMEKGKPKCHNLRHTWTTQI